MIKNLFKNKALLIIITLITVLVIGIDTTVSILISKTERLNNEFVPTDLSCKVNELLDNGVKRNVNISNTGSADGYVRAELIFTWQDSQGNVYGEKPMEGSHYTASYDFANGWLKSQDGYYYWTEPVAPGDSTGVLLTSCTPITGRAPEGYSLNVEILASIIQSEPVSVVLDIWETGISSINNGILEIIR